MGVSVLLKKCLARMRDERGQALLIVLGIGAVVMILLMALMMTTDSEIKQARSNQSDYSLDWVGRSARSIVQESFNEYIWGPIAQGIEDKEKINEGLIIDSLLSNDPLMILENALSVTRQEADKMYFVVDLDDPNVIVPGTASITNKLDDNRGFDAALTVRPGGTAHFSGDNSMYVFPISFEANVRSRVTAKSSKVNSGFNRETTTAFGNFTMYICRGSFSAYVMFMEETGGVRLTVNDHIKGPMHSNGAWNFVGNPSTLLTGTVTQSDKLAGFYVGNKKYPTDGDHYPPNEKDPQKIKVRPIFQRGFYRGVPKISLPTDLSEFKDGVLYGRSVPAGNVGIVLPTTGDETTPGDITPGGGIYIKGDADITLQQGDKSQTYLIVQYETKREQVYNPKKNKWEWQDIEYRYEHTITEDYSTEKTTVTTKTVMNGDEGNPTITGPTIHNRTFRVNPESTLRQNAIYVDGNITALNGEIDRNASLSVCAKKDVTINGHLRYEDKDDVTAPHKLGVLSETGDVTVDYFVDENGKAPEEIDMHASIMTPHGVFSLCDALQRAVVYPDLNQGKGKLNIWGGIISQQLGATEKTVQNQGYGLMCEYDNRLMYDPPPLFPKLESCKMTTNKPGGIGSGGSEGEETTIQWIWSAN